MISCSNELCVYQNNERCTLREISVDTMGRCIECLSLNIPSEQLRKIKRMFYGESSIVYRIQPHPKLSVSASSRKIHFSRGKIKQGRIKKGLIYRFVKK